MEENYFVDDILDNKKRKKKVNGNKKGKRTELGVAKLLTERFGQSFSRSVGSGNRWSQANLPQHAREVFSGDLVCPSNFLFSIESKGGYEDEIDLNSVLFEGNARLDSFLKQAEDDGERCGRKPLILWKRARKPWLSMLKTNDLPHLDWKYRLIYKDWSMVSLDSLLALPDEFFYEEKSN